jgi:hypothetical protein
VAVVHGEIVRSSPDALDRLRAAAGGRLPVVLVDRGYSDERRGSEEARAFGAVAFVPLPPDPGELADVLRSARLGAGSTEATGRFPTAAPAESPGERDGEQAARFIERLWSRLADLDAYQLLRVAPDASDTDIQAAFRQRALEFHPDRQRTVMDEETRERIYQIFKRVSRAFREVGDPAARRVYDARRPPDSKRS